MKKVCLLAAVLALAVCASPVLAGPAFTWASAGFGVPTYTPGWMFVPTADITVTALGFYVPADSFAPPLAGPVLMGSHSVNIWQYGNATTPVASAVVAATTSPVLDSSGYTYQAIAPVTLTKGTMYFLMASVMVVPGSAAYSGNGTPFTATDGGNLDTGVRSPVGFTPAPEVGYVTGVYNNSPGTGFALYPYGYDGAYGDYLAGNFQYDVPEPATMGLLGLGLGGMWLRKRK